MSSRISADAVESRLPVGSSANITVGFGIGEPPVAEGTWAAPGY